LTARITGDARPKQFCPLVDGETLLDRTRRRVDLFTRPDRQVVAVSRPHEQYYEYLRHELAPGRLVVQPANRDTGPGVFYALLRVAALAGDIPVAVFPSDHYVSDDQAFMSYARRAVEVVHARPDLVVLLGIESSSPETEYGWIEPADCALQLDGDPVFPVRRFWEKPPARVALRLMSRGCLWNSFVMVGWVSAFVDLIETAAPELAAAFAPLRHVIGSRKEAAVLERVYARLPTLSFAGRVLAHTRAGLATVPVKGVQWSDWGSPERVLASLRRAGRTPSWLESAIRASS
jgi:mannose-1-phosphate guanylyltransferase